MQCLYTAKGYDLLSIFRAQTYITAQDLIYAGLRNGLVCRIDTRLPKCHEFLLFGSTASPVRKVSVVGDSELFVARQNGEASRSYRWFKTGIELVASM